MAELTKGMTQKGVLDQYEEWDEIGAEKIQTFYLHGFDPSSGMFHEIEGLPREYIFPGSYINSLTVIFTSITSNEY